MLNNVDSTSRRWIDYSTACALWDITLSSAQFVFRVAAYKTSIANIYEDRSKHMQSSYKQIACTYAQYDISMVAVCIQKKIKWRYTGNGTITKHGLPKAPKQGEITSNN